MTIPHYFTKRLLLLLSCGLAMILVSNTAAASASSLSVTTLATAGLDGKGIQDDMLTSDYHALSADGRTLVYSANSNNLVQGDTNTKTEIFAYDTVAKKTERIKANNGDQVNGNSYTPAVSANGQYIAFISSADNIVSGNTNAGCSNQWSCWNIYVYDRVAKHSVMANLNTLGLRLDAMFDESPLAISADGNFVAFQSQSPISATDTNNESDILVRDLSAHVTRLASGGQTTPEFGSWEASTHPSISGDGRYVAFNTYRNLTSDDKNNSRDVYVYDQQMGATTRASKSAYNAVWNSDSFRPRISTDGQYVVFESAAALLPRDTNNTQDIYEYALMTGKTTLVSAATNGTLANGSSYRPAPSADGRLVVFQSGATNLVKSDTNENDDIFIHYRDFGVTRRVSLGSQDKPQANNSSHYGTISGDGKTVSFQSPATNLTPGQSPNWGYNLFTNRNPVVDIPYYDDNDYLDLF